MLLTALLFNTLTGVVCASVLGFSPVAGAVGMNAVAAFMGCLLYTSPSPRD